MFHSRWTTRCYILENVTVHNRFCENFKSNIQIVWFQVQGTNDFNTVSKCSMIKSGYFRDDYVSYFVTRCSRRTPLIHLGYYMRVLTVDYTLQSFLDSILGRPAQVNISTRSVSEFVYLYMSSRGDCRNIWSKFVKNPCWVFQANRHTWQYL